MILTQRKLLWISLLITLLQTSLVLHYSAREGRLALPVYFDDNHSLVDGARRLEIWYQHGTTALFRDYVANPPHAPGHSALAIVAFALFGLHAWAPYLTNALFFWLILYALLLILKGIDPWLQLACMIFLAATPIAGISILEFRSEVNVAELGAAGIILYLLGSGGNHPLRSRVSLPVSALCFAACFIVKPAVFPYTLGLMGLCVLFDLRRLFVIGGERISARAYFQRLGLFAALAILPPLPHYILDWHHIMGYIGAVAFSPASIWLRHDDLISGLLFHVTGYPGRIMLGPSLKPHAALIAVALILRFVRSDSWPGSLPLLTLIYFTLGAYLGVAVNPMNQNYFGMTFHWLFLITTLVALTGIILTIFPKHTSTVGFMLAAMGTVAFFFLKFPLSIDFYREKANSDPETFTWLQQSPYRILGALREEHDKTGATKVWITAYTMINARTMEWYTLLERGPFEYKDFYEYDLRAVPTRLEWADVVVVPEMETPSIEHITPGAEMAESIINILDRDPRFNLYKRFGSPHNGPGFRIYVKKTL